MNIIRRRGWEIPERLATPEHLVFNRRNFLIGGASALAVVLTVIVMAVVGGIRYFTRDRD
jgi:hypothetical protein